MFYIYLFIYFCPTKRFGFLYPISVHHSLGMLVWDMLTTHELHTLCDRYDCTATPADYEIYAPKAVFEDPLMQAHG